MIKTTLLLTLFFFFTTPALAKEKRCSWVNSETFSAMKNSTESIKKSKGWIYCKDSTLGSVVLEKATPSKKKWIQKTLKSLYPNFDSQEETGRKTYSFATRVVKQVRTQNDTFDVVFFLLKNKNKHFVFYAELLERPYKGDLNLATEEIEKILTAKPELFQN